MKQTNPRRRRHQGNQATSPREARRLRDEAAKPILERVHRNAIRSGEDLLARALEEIARSLFEPGFNATELYHRLRIGDHNFALRFHGEIGHPPARYLEELRMETARALLSTTRLPIWQIAEVVGYSGNQVFGRAFRRVHDETATEYRSRTLRPDRRDDDLSDATLRGILLGEGSEEEVDAVVERLSDLMRGRRR